ncbi:MAG: OsmC family peroxiredoxin [Gaiellaceae bacterium]
MAVRTAAATWSGGLLGGSGTVHSSGSGALGELPVTWAARSEERSGGKTSPEELIAAAHASCYAMALSNQLADNGTPAEQLDVTASVTFVPGTGITTSQLELRGRVPRIDAATFAGLAEGAKENCPVSKALAGVEISLSASLVS